MAEKPKEYFLEDTSYTRLPKIEPIHVSSVFGAVRTSSSTASSFNPIANLVQLTNDRVFLSSITIHFTNHLTGMELTYYNKDTDEEYYCEHFSKTIKENEQKRALLLSETDFLTGIKVSYDKRIYSLSLTTSKGNNIEMKNNGSSKSKECCFKQDYV